MKRGVVIGKFYPPHKGHHFLINKAKISTDQLTVIVCDKKDQTISGNLRAKWLREIHPDVNVVVTPDDLSDDDSMSWAKRTLKILGYVPDMVFTSEDYGDKYAQIMGSKHILVDKQRKMFPISGTVIRNDPFNNWQYLEPPVKAYFTKRICILGAESTGTTTLARDLAKYYKTIWVPEYGRLYAEGKMFSPSIKNWVKSEFVHIAKMQNILEDELAKYAEKLLICDTNSWVTSIWHERYIGKWSKDVEKLSLGRKYNLYLITDLNTPFVQDETRDGEHLRQWMHNRFIEQLTKEKKQFMVIDGSKKERLKKAISLINNIFQ